MGPKKTAKGPTTVVLTGPPPNEITSFCGNYNFLSNFFYSPIKQDGLEYPTVEHAFQAAKCPNRADKMSILAHNSPTVAKRVGRRVPLRSDWERVKLDIMYDILSQKFAASGPLHEPLLATGEAELVEGNVWHDDYWGNCVCDKHRATRGSNHLGKLIMRVRDELRCAKREQHPENHATTVSQTSQKVDSS